MKRNKCKLCGKVVPLPSEHIGSMAQDPRLQHLFLEHLDVKLEGEFRVKEWFVKPPPQRNSPKPIIVQRQDGAYILKEVDKTKWMKTL